MVFYRSCVVFVGVFITVKVSCECGRNYRDCTDSKNSDCQSGYFPDRKGICQICAENCRTCLNETTCKTCVSGLFPHPNGQCEPCGENCFRCANETNCEVCETKSILENGRCKKCQDNCNKCAENNTCSLCNTQFYVKNGRCEDCRPRCLDCSSYDNCTECTSGFWGPICNEICLYVNSSVSECKDGKCDRETGECIECEEGTFGVMCENLCPSNCQKSICDMHGNCSEGCLQGFYGDTCNNTCPKNCQDYVCAMNGNCTQGCKAGYYGIFCDKPCRESENGCVNFECFRTNGTCIQECPHNCISCISKTNCTVCKTGFYGNSCDHSCEDCIERQCSLDRCKHGCKDGLYSDKQSCKPCSPNCSRCTSFDECEKCLDGWYGPTCQLECDRTSCFACEISSNRCTKCKPGYTLRNNTCCPQNCLNCDGNARCLNCSDGFYGDTCQDSCMENCKTCSSRDNCTECGLHFYDSKSELTAGLCMCDVRECEVNASVESCRQCKQPGWYTHKRGCCPCPKYCKDQSDCKLFTGNCINGCQKGWVGSHCDKRCNIKHCVTCKKYDTCQQCENEYYGHACQYNCSLGCVQSSEGPLCDVETGHCLHGCENGSWGQTCNRTCGNNCVNGYCNSTTGQCLECKSTHFGLNCEKEAESKLTSRNPMVQIIFVCIAICAALCIIVVAVVMVKKKRSKRGNKDSDINERSVEMDAVGTTPAGATGRQRPNPDDEVITENAVYEPFLPLNTESEINAQNALLVKPGSSGEEEMTNDYTYPAPVDPDAVYALPIKDGSRA